MIDKSTSLSYALSKRRAGKSVETKKLKAAHERQKLELEIVQDPEESKYRIADRHWCEKIGHELVKHYPGHGWEVTFNIKQGIMDVRNRHMHPLAGYRLKLSEFNFSRFSSQMRKIGGEILERFGLSRERFEADKIRQIQHDTKGRAKVDLS